MKKVENPISFKQYFSEQDINQLSARIIDCFSDLLDEHDISIPDEYREGNEEESSIYGDTYYTLESQISSMISDFLELGHYNSKVDNEAAKINPNIKIPESFKKMKK